MFNVWWHDDGQLAYYIALELQTKINIKKKT